MSKVCRLCLTKLQKGSKYFNINAVESYTGFMPYRDQLTTCIPEMALDLIPNPIFCWSCRSALKAFYTFKTRCLNVERILQQYVEYYHLDTITINLSDIDTSSLQDPYESKSNKKIKSSSIITEKNKNSSTSALQQKHQQEKIEAQSKPLLSSICHIVKENDEVFLPNLTEIEITNVSNGTTSDARSSTNKSSQENEPIEEVSIYEQKDSDSITDDTITETKKKSPGLECDHCPKKFQNQTILYRHKTKIHDIFICNFCNLSFKTLQCLRRHNQLCQKLTNPGTIKNVLSRRPQLPANAKNHLKRWLFRHTEHPYPTDSEKQELMKETNLSLLQVENWFINARRRILNDMTKLKKTIFKDLKGYDNLFEQAAEKLFKEDEKTEKKQTNNDKETGIESKENWKELQLSILSQTSENCAETVKGEDKIKENDFVESCNLNTNVEHMDIEINQ